MLSKDFTCEEKNKTTLSSLNNESEKHLLRNYKQFYKLLVSYIESKKPEYGDEHEYIIELVETHFGSIDVIVIKVNDDVAAYEIFETVNSKNEPLTSSDLIKNEILRNLDKNDKYENIWNNVIDNISKHGFLNFNQFLRYFWLANFGWSTERKLYANFKSHLKKMYKEKW